MDNFEKAVLAAVVCGVTLAVSILVMTAVIQSIAGGTFQDNLTPVLIFATIGIIGGAYFAHTNAKVAKRDKKKEAP